MWLAGLFAALASIIYPSISALVSKNASSEQQGVALGILTGMRGLCNGLGPALFGLLFWLFNVSLSEAQGNPDILTQPQASAAHTITGMKNVTVERLHVSRDINCMLCIFIRTFLAPERAHFGHNTLWQCIPLSLCTM